MNGEMTQLLADYRFNRSDLARELGVTPQAIAKAYLNGYFSNPLAIKVEQITNGKYKAVDLCKHSR